MVKNSIHSIESRLKISAGKTGVPVSPETRKKMSEAHRKAAEERQRQKVELEYLRSLSIEDRELIRSLLGTKELITR